MSKVCSNLLSTLTWWENANFVRLMKAQITRMWIKLHQPLYMNYARTLTPIDTLLKFITNENKLGNEKCIVTFGVEYIYDRFKKY